MGPARAVLPLLLAPALAAAQKPDDPEPPPLRETITVEAKAPSEEDSGSTATSVAGDTVRELPARPSNVRDALPYIPGVVRTPAGKLNISAGGEHRSTLLIDSLDVTDPATGKFGATVPIDSVESLNVYKSPFLAEYGRFTAGVVAVETKRGGELWHWELNDPTPEFRIRSRRLRGIRGFTPRLSWSGPLSKNKLYYSQSVEYRLNKTPVFALPFPHNEEKRELWNSLARIDYIASPRHWVTASVHGVPQKTNFEGLNFYTPQPAAPWYAGHEYRGSVSDRYQLAGGLLESAVAFGEVMGRTGPQGAEEFTFTPTLHTGNYFLRQDRRAARVEWREAYAMRPVAARGTHGIKFGASVMRTHAEAAFRARAVNIRGLDGRALRRIDYDNAAPMRLSDYEVGVFGQDHWQAAPSLAIDTGLRADWQRVTGLTRLAPRAALVWTPLGENGPAMRGGLGWFYDRVPLSIYAFDAYPRQIIDGLPFDNLTETASLPRPLVFGSRRPGNFSPRSRTWNAQIDQRANSILRLRAGWLQSDSSGLMTLRPEPGALALGGRGRSRLRQFESIARLSWKPEQELFFSYVHSRARGNLNEFAEFLGDFPHPLVRPDAVTEAAANIPHRFLAWGVVPMKYSLLVAPVVEYRSGFPYIAVDEAQNYFGVPNTRRFPRFFSLDLRVARDMEVEFRGRRHRFRISFSAFNLTNHWNPTAVRLNSADPQFGEFLARRPRRFQLDFDFLN